MNFVLMESCSKVRCVSKLADEMSGFHKETFMMNNDTVAEMIQDAEKGDLDAQYWLGNVFHLGKIVEKDDVRALRWYLLSALQGHCLARVELGTMLCHTGGGVSDQDSANFVLVEALSEEGNLNALCIKGLMYSSGRGVAKNDVLALYCFNKAADSGHPGAQNNLGVLYEWGCAVPLDKSVAVEWYRKAAEQGDASAQANIARMYENGCGIPRDMAFACRWLRMAAAQDYERARESLINSYRVGFGFVEDIAFAFDLCEEVAKREDVETQFDLGWMFMIGLGGTSNLGHAVEWYLKAADKNHMGARCMLSVMALHLKDNTTIDWNMPNAYSKLSGMSGFSRCPEVQALFDFCRPEMYQNNIFNVLGLSVYATPMEIQDCRNNFNNADSDTKWSLAFPHLLGRRKIPSRLEVCDAFTRIEIPQQRLVATLFWFWPIECDNPEDATQRAIMSGLLRNNVDMSSVLWGCEDVLADPMKSTIAKHNLAVWQGMRACNGFLDPSPDLSACESMSSSQSCNLGMVVGRNYVSHKLFNSFGERVSPNLPLPGRCGFRSHFKALGSPPMWRKMSLPSEDSNYANWQMARGYWEEVFKSEPFWIYFQSLFNTVCTHRFPNKVFTDLRHNLLIALSYVNGRIVTQLVVENRNIGDEIRRLNKFDTTVGFHLAFMRELLGGSQFSEGLLTELLYQSSRAMVNRACNDLAAVHAAPKEGLVVGEKLRDDGFRLLVGLRGLLLKENQLHTYVSDFIAMSVMECFSLFLQQPRASYNSCFSAWKGLSTYARSDVVSRVIANALAIQENVVYQTCWFCKKQPAEPGYEFKYAVHRLKSLHEYEWRELPVPRCSYCCEKHKQHEAWRPTINSSVINFFMGTVNQTEKDRPPLPSGVLDVSHAYGFPSVEFATEADGWSEGKDLDDDDIIRVKRGRDIMGNSPY